MTIRKAIMSTGLVAAVSCGLYAWSEHDSKQVHTSGLRPYKEMKAISLITEFETDEESANQEYTDKVVAVYGKIVRIEKNDSTQTVLLEGRSAMAGVVCQFEPYFSGQVEGLHEGEQVSIKGICTGALMDVVLARCVLNDN